MKVFIRTVNAAGHLYACVGFAQSLEARGHQVTFLIDETYTGEVEKNGFKAIGLKPKNSDLAGTSNKADDGKPREHPFKAMSKMLITTGFLANKSPLEKMSLVSPDIENSFFKHLMSDCIHASPQIEEILKIHQPDVSIIDNFLVEPAFHLSNIPYIYQFSGNPLGLYESEELPPLASGLPVEGAEEEKEVFRKVFKVTFERLLEDSINQMWESCTGSLPPGGAMKLMSSNLKIYGYPEELDYQNIVERPANLIGVDAFCRETPGKFELPKEFKAKIQADDKLIYLSMGSMGAANTDMVNRLLDLVADSRHKFIVSMGPLHEDIKLPDNAWGEAFLPQTHLLPLVDLVITHGGNNSVTETFVAGKPMIVMPLFMDQFDNAQRVHETGYGVRLNPFECTKGELNEAIEKLVNDQEVAQRLKVAAKRIANSNSKEKAVIEIEKFVANHKK